MRKLIFISGFFLLLYACKPAAKVKEFDSVSIVEAEKLGKEIEKDIEQGKKGELEKYLDIESLVDRAFSSRKINQSQKDACIRVLPDYAIWGSDVDEAVANEGSFLMLIAKEEKGETKLIFHFLNGDEGFDFFELYLGKTKGDKPRIIIKDIYSYYFGDFLSTIAVSEMLAYEEDLQRLNIELNETSKHLKAEIESIDRIYSLLEEGNSEPAMEVWETMSNEYKQSKTGLRLKINIANELGDRTYGKALDAFATQFPDDPSLDLVMLDKGFMDDDTALVGKYLASLEKRIGTPVFYLSYLKANSIFSYGDCKNALELSTQLLSKDPNWEDLYWIAIRCYAKEGMFEEAMVYADHVETYFDVEAADFANSDDYPELIDFVKSPLFKNRFPIEEE